MTVLFNGQLSSDGTDGKVAAAASSPACRMISRSVISVAAREIIKARRRNGEDTGEGVRQERRSSIFSAVTVIKLLRSCYGYAATTVLLRGALFLLSSACISLRNPTKTDNKLNCLSEQQMNYHKVLSDLQMRRR